MNGDIIPLEINPFDNDDRILNKICNYNNKYRLRKHRIKIFKESISDLFSVGKEEYENKSFKEIIYNIEDNDILFLYSDPPSNVKEYYSKYSNIENEYNYFYIKNIEDYHDTIDRIYLEIYDKELPSLFIIDYNFFNIGYSQMYIDILMKTIFKKEDIKHIVFNCSYINQYLPVFINCLIKYYRDLDTIYIDLNYNKNLNHNRDIKKLFDKINNTKNIYINTGI